MSTENVAQCNGCGVRTEDYLDELGWIRLDSNAPIRVSVQLGRRKDRMAKSITHDDETCLDFCRKECMADWIWRDPRRNHRTANSDPQRNADQA